MKKSIIVLFLAAIMVLSSLPCVFAAPSNADFIRIEMGEVHVVALKSDGTVWTWGSNMFHALGDGTERSKYVPTHVIGIDDVIDIAAGRGYTIALKSDGTVWGWGSNYAKQLGFSRDRVSEAYTPIQLDWLENIVAINCSDIETYMLDASGQTYINGEPDSQDFRYKKSDPSGKYKILAGGNFFSTAENSISSIGIKEDGSVWIDDIELKEYHGARDAAVVSTNGYIITADGKIVAIGNNRYGQLGSGFTSRAYVPHKIEGVSDVKDVSAWHNIYVLHNDGTVSTMYNRNIESRFAKVPINDAKKIAQTASTVAVLKNDGTVWTWQLTYNKPDPEPPVPVMVNGLSDIVNISATQSHILAFDKNGKVYVDGYVDYEFAELDDNGEPKSWFNALGGVENVADGYFEYYSSMFLTTDNRILTSSISHSGGNSTSNGYEEADIGGKAKELAVNIIFLGHSAVLKDDGVVCITIPYSGVDGYIDIPNLPFITHISMTPNALLASDIDGHVWQLGADNGNLGGEDNMEYRQPYCIPGLNNIATVAAGYNYHFAITNTGELYAWGENEHNQLFESNYYTASASWQPIKSSVINMTIGSTAILVNNFEIAIPAAPVIVDSRTLVPIREVAENLGGSVEWEASGQITVTMGQDILVLNIGSLESQYNGHTETIDVAPALIDDKTFLPLRYVCETLGAEVLWEETAQRITIVK